MTQTLLFVVLPYLAITICIVGSIIRIRSMPMTYSSLSSQFLESKALVWGSVPWHIGIMTILSAHIFALLLPELWQSLMGHPLVLYLTESVGLAFSIACLFGLLVLSYRRITCDRLQSVTTSIDLLVLGLLIIQVGLGIMTALFHRWGAAWATGTLVPYLWGLFSFQANLSLIEDMPHLVKAHMVCAWLLILLVPFSRLIHMFAVPLQYLLRPPINVVWNNPRKLEQGKPTFKLEEARREFIKGGFGIVIGITLLGAGLIDKLFFFFFGPRLSKEEEGEMMKLRLERLNATANQRQLELERQTSNHIFIAPLNELSKTEGKYFIDYSMSPALAFLGENGLPNLLSAKCTHLGCTVGNEVKDGRILCPCHVSYFDITTGEPNSGAPAKSPLPFLSWLLIDAKQNIIASRNSKGILSGDTRLEAIKDCGVYIPKGDSVQS